MTPARLVVVGNGMAGARLLEEVLARGGGDRYTITVFGDEPHGGYNRILLSEVLAAGGAEDSDELFLNPHDWYDDHGITLHAGVRIVRVDRREKVVLGDDGSVTPYDVLVLATGSRSFFPPIEGLWASPSALTPGVFGFRSLDDVTALLAHVRRPRTAVVVGGGLLGLEAAAGLQAHGAAVHVVHPTEVLMDQQLGAEAAGVLRGTLEQRGLHLHLGVRASEILTSDGSVSGVRFTDGSELAADTVVVTAGVRPNVGLAAAAGLTTQAAIVVDDTLRSVDDEAVHAVGECAQHRGEVYGVVAPLWEQAAVLADVLTGADPAAAYRGSRLATKLKVAGVEVAQMGLRAPERSSDEVVRYAASGRGVHQSLVIRDGALVGATLVGDVSRVAALTQALDSRSALPADRAQLLFDLGAPGAGAVADLPDDARVCQCNRVSKGDLLACVARGADSVAACAAATRAGTGCGSCQPLVKEIVEAALEAEGPEDPIVVGGVTSPDQLRHIADVAERHDVPVVELLGGSGVALRGVPPATRRALREDLDRWVPRAP
ncbi:FAD-dependent oxidoreductase [Actinomycetospora lutea]|uniref:FAD-dependent oxidoreductase n=1 Tax=Actinomycetospora lutea TaxID=663604 RepID=UPI00236522AB|nr:FAD-dependent oxidoreductase [Actinomycetospora lutea]MDD7939252.1 FAD-dependent oxidoreductase [Actinomycetospora lutea]